MEYLMWIQCWDAVASESGWKSTLASNDVKGLIKLMKNQYDKLIKRKMSDEESRDSNYAESESVNEDDK